MQIIVIRCVNAPSEQNIRLRSVPLGAELPIVKSLYDAIHFLAY